MSFRVSDGIGTGTPGHVHALVGLDDAAGQNGAACPPALDRLDPEPDESVVDENVVPALEDLAHGGRRNRQLAVTRCVLGGDDDLVPGVERHRAGQLADAHLGPL